MATQITALPTPPSRQRPTEFSNEADTFLGALPTFGTEVNLVAGEVNTNATNASLAAVTATTQAGISTSQAGVATTQANNAATSAQLSESWANKTTGTIDGTEYSSKEYAIGTNVPVGSSKDWATKVGDTVDGVDYSAKHYAQEAELLTEKYQGALLSDPTLDKSGNPLEAGDWYVNTATGYIRAYNGSSWVQGISGVAGVASINGETGDVTGVVKENTTQILTNKTLTDPLLLLGGSNGTFGQVPISQGTGLPPVWGIASEIKVLDRTSNVIITSDNRTNLINISSGTFTQTFDSANTLGNGWWCYLRNNGNGDITLSPNSPNTVDGLSSYIMYPGEMRLIISDGTNLHSVVIKSFYKVFTTSGNFIKPPGYTRFSGLLWGGGGGGGKSSTNILGGGGGGCAPVDYAPSQLGATTSVMIAASVTGSTTSTGSAGNISTFANTTAYGATAFSGTGTGTTAGGSAFIQDTAAATFNYTYSGGKSTTETYAYFGGAGGGNSMGKSPTVFGGGGGGGITSASVQPIFGTTIFGGAGGAAADTANGGDGTAPGGGGGSTKTGTKGGDGARGELRLWGVV